MSWLVWEIGESEEISSLSKYLFSIPLWKVWHCLLGTSSTSFPSSSPGKHLLNATFLSFGELMCNTVSQKITPFYSVLKVKHEWYPNSLKNGIWHEKDLAQGKEMRVVTSWKGDITLMRGKSYMHNLLGGLLPPLVSLDSVTQASLHSWVLMTVTERNACGWRGNPALEGNQVSWSKFWVSMTWIIAILSLWMHQKQSFESLAGLWCSCTSSKPDC